jgi:hypothetical protein
VELERIPGVPVVSTATGLVELKITRRQEWGPSVSVNAVEIRTNETSETVLEIEMQSGDTIEIAAARVEVS